MAKLYHILFYSRLKKSSPEILRVPPAKELLRSHILRVSSKENMGVKYSNEGTLESYIIQRC